ncbi:jg25406, partial [Pararge aegeria aegeria]
LKITETEKQLNPDEGAGRKIARRTKQTKVSRCWNDDLAPVNAVFDNPQRVGQTGQGIKCVDARRLLGQKTNIQRSISRLK